ncbi:hypothetical protein [Robbsia sp. KACC 23696]|uniref:hypothetical protein n=1 Tax=Robbsia sp. KACC 23696 TaxID=3149231 RepID=UPI00325AD008
MMTFDSSITRVSAVDPVGGTSAASAAASLARPDAATATPNIASGTGGTPDAIAPASADQVDKFKTMLDQATLNAQSNPHASTGPSAIANVVDSQDAAFNQIGSEMQSFQANATTMDPREFTATMVRMQFQVADAMARIELGVGFAQGGKSAVQNLMKNQ